MIDEAAQGEVQRLYNAANDAILQGQPQTAQGLVEQALALVPSHPAVLRLQGRILGMLGRDRDAANVFRRVTELDPADAGAWSDLGMALGRLGRDPEAIDALGHAIERDPQHGAALELLATAHYRTRNLVQAIEIGQRAVAAAPDNGHALTNLLFASMIACDWTTVRSLSERLDRMTDAALAAGRTPAETPHLSVIRCPDPDRNLAIARATAASIATRALRQAPVFPPVAAGARTRIRIGYLSAHFRDHPAAHLCAGIFEAHDRARFDIVAFADGPAADDLYRSRIRRSVDRWIEIGSLDAMDAARTIRDAAIDVLVVIGGHTRGSRLEICVWRPAPVQIAYFDFPGSLGAGFIDYAVVDDIVLPPNLAARFTEKPIVLPHCYQPNDARQPVAVPPPTRATLGLPEKSVVLAAPVNPYKIVPDLFDCWMRLLVAAPDAVLWLPGCNELAAANLRIAARDRGVAAQRLIVDARIAKPAHLARLSQADLALDSWFCNGHTTTSDCLYAGVPVVALEGTHFATRVSASLLTAAGLPELIAANSGEYEALALALIREPARRRRMHDVLTKDRHRHALFDTARYVRALEAGFTAAWERFIGGHGPAAIRIRDDGTIAAEAG